jgi:glycosyltransferase involved in cell wall biosynthesis
VDGPAQGVEATGLGGAPGLLSVVVCLREPGRGVRLRRHYARTAGCAHECVFVDNGAHQYGLCAAYNEGVRRARGEVIAFVHDDVRFLESGWGARLLGMFADDETLGLVGVAGGQVLAKVAPWWPGLWDSFAVSRVFHEYGSRRFPRIGRFRRRWVAFRNPIPEERLRMEAVTVDGVFMAVRASLFDHVRFDDVTFTGFHMYDADLCMQVRRTHRILVVPDLFLKHHYRTKPAAMVLFRRDIRRFLDKYRDELPVASVPWDVVRAKLSTGSENERLMLRHIESELAEKASRPSS